MPTEMLHSQVPLLDPQSVYARALRYLLHPSLFPFLLLPLRGPASLRLSPPPVPGIGVIQVVARAQSFLARFSVPTYRVVHLVVEHCLLTSNYNFCQSMYVYKLLILKRNSYYNVNKRVSSSKWTTLYNRARSHVTNNSFDFPPHVCCIFYRTYNHNTFIGCSSA